MPCVCRSSGRSSRRSTEMLTATRHTQGMPLRDLTIPASDTTISMVVDYFTQTGGNVQCHCTSITARTADPNLSFWSAISMPTTLSVQNATAKKYAACSLYLSLSAAPARIAHTTMPPQVWAVVHAVVVVAAVTKLLTGQVYISCLIKPVIGAA